MKALAANTFAVTAGLAIGMLSTFLAVGWMLSDESADAVFAALILGPIFGVEVTAGAIATLVLVANERRAAAAGVAAALALLLFVEVAWLV